MPNIDPVLFLQPAASLAISLAALVYWWNRRGVRGTVLALSAVAYFLAIGAKYAIQIPTISAVIAAFGPSSVALGLYYGLQTVFLEVGLAYVFALYGARKRGFKTSDAVPYGISLSFWENGIFLGLFSFASLAVTYLLLASGTSAGTAAYTALSTTQPSLFLPPDSLLPPILLGTLERVSSMLIHIAWGALCVLAAVARRRRYLAYALPMGMVDAIVPFAKLNLPLFEAGIFLLSLGFVVVAWKSMKAAAPQPAAVVGA